MKISDLIEELGVTEEEIFSLVQTCGIEITSIEEELDDDIVVQVKNMVQIGREKESQVPADQEPVIQDQKEMSDSQQEKEVEDIVDGTIKRLNPSLEDLAENLGMDTQELLAGVNKVGILIDDPTRELSSEEGKKILDSLHVIESEITEMKNNRASAEEPVAADDQEKVTEDAGADAPLGHQDIELKVVKSKAKDKDDDFEIKRHDTVIEKKEIDMKVTASSSAKKQTQDKAINVNIAGDDKLSKIMDKKGSSSVNDDVEIPSQVIEDAVNKDFVEDTQIPVPDEDLADQMVSTDVSRAELEREALKTVVDAPVSKGIFKNPLFWLAAVFIAFISVFLISTVILLKSKEPASKKPMVKVVEQVVLTEEEIPASSEGDVALLRLIWRMDSDGFYKSAYEMCARFEDEYPGSDLLEDVLFKKADVLYKWEKYPPVNQYNPAIEAADAAAAEYPQSSKAPWAIFLKGRAYSQLKDDDKALEAYSEIIKAYPFYARLDEVLFSVAEAYLNKGKYDVAEKEYLRVISRFPSSEYKSQVYYKIGVCLDKQNRFDDAISAFRRFMQMYPEDLNRDEAQLALAEIYFRISDYAQAEKAFRKTIGRYPYDTYNDRALFMVAECMAKEKDYKGAMKILDELIYNYRNSEYAARAMFKMGDYYYEARNMKQAVKYYETALESYPDHELVRSTVLLLGSLYLENQEHERAIAFFRHRLANYPDTGVNDKILLLLGKAYYAKGIYIAAVNAFDKINILEETSTLEQEQIHEVYFLKAEAYFSAELYGEAKEAYMRLINKYPELENTDYFYYQLGMSSYYLAQFNEAIETLNVAMEKFPLSKYRYSSRLIIGKCYVELKRVEKAVENFERIVKNEYLRGRDVYYEASLELARIYHEQGVSDRALALYDEVIGGNVTDDMFFKAVREKGAVLSSLGSIDKMIKSYDEIIKILLAREVFTEEKQRDRLEKITDLYIDLADAMFINKQFEKAGQYYDKAYQTLKNHPKTDWILYQLGNSYNELNNHKQAAIYYELLKEEFIDSYWTRQLDWSLKRLELKQGLITE